MHSPLRFILIFTQAGYVHRLGVAILIAHWANYDYIRGREGYPAIPLNIPFPDWDGCELGCWNVRWGYVLLQLSIVVQEGSALSKKWCCRNSLWQVTNSWVAWLINSRGMYLFYTVSGGPKTTRRGGRVWGKVRRRLASKVSAISGVGERKAFIFAIVICCCLRNKRFSITVI